MNDVISTYWQGEGAPMNTLVTENDRRALKKAKEREQERIKQGWQFVKITPRMKVFVPCKNGKPTKEGENIIKRYKEYLGIIKID